MGRRSFLQQYDTEPLGDEDQAGAARIEKYIPPSTKQAEKMRARFRQACITSNLSLVEGYRKFVGRLVRAQYAPSSIRTNSEYIWPLVQRQASWQLVEFNKAIDAYSTSENTSGPRKTLTGRELFACMSALKDDQEYLMCFICATVGARPSDTGRMKRKYYTWSRTGSGVTDGHYRRFCAFGKNVRKLSDRKATPDIPFTWIWPMTKRGELLLKSMEGEAFVIGDYQATYSTAYVRLKTIARRLYPLSDGNICPMDFRRHYIHTVMQHVPLGRVHLYTLHAAEGMVRAHYATFEKGNEGSDETVGQKRLQPPVNPEWIRSPQRQRLQ